MARDINYKVNKRGTLEKWAKYTVADWQRKQKELKMGDSMKLYQSFAYHVILAANGDFGKVKFLYQYYGMFSDMGVGKGVSLNEVKDLSSSRRLEGQLLGNRRRPKKWYTKPLAYQVKRLAEIMRDVYGEQALLVFNEIPNRVQLG